jgi:hypothetical protein
MRHSANKAGMAALTILLAACQNSPVIDDRESGESVATLRAGSATQTESMSQNDLVARLNTIEEGRWTLEVAGAPTCGVDVFHYEYNTIDGRGDPVTASSALMVPRGDAELCNTPNPIVIGLHGTMPDKLYNQADLSGKNPGSNRAIAWAGVYAAQGYIVVAPNYTGFDTSNADHHSYLDAKQQTQDILDALQAARELLPDVSAQASEKLFIVGYSQGGWATMALHREMESRGMSLTASMPMSGPYGLTAIVDDVFRGRVVQGSTIYFGLAIRAMQVAYGYVYDAPGDIYAEKYADAIATLFPSETPHYEWIMDGTLPATALFNDRPVTPPGVSDVTRSALSEGTPATTPERFASIFAQGFGPDHLLNDAYRLDYLEDIAAHPDGAWPDYTTGEPAEQSGNGLRRAMIKNDLRGWTPKNPLVMCGGQGDGAALLQYGGELMMQYWSDPAHAPAPGIVSLLDFDAPIMPADPFAEIKSDYLERKDAIVSQYESVPDWVNTYHQILLPRYCYTAARDYFETLR